MLTSTALRLWPYALAVVAGAWLLWQAQAWGYSRAEAACIAAQEAARRAHEVEVARIADAASVAEAEALAARRTVKEMTDALARETRPACPVSGTDADRLRGIIDAARGAAAKPAAR